VACSAGTDLKVKLAEEKAVNARETSKEILADALHYRTPEISQAHLVTGGEVFVDLKMGRKGDKVDVPMASVHLIPTMSLIASTKMATTN